MWNLSRGGWKISGRSFKKRARPYLEPCSVQPISWSTHWESRAVLCSFWKARCLTASLSVGMKEEAGNVSEL